MNKTTQEIIMDKVLGALTFGLIVKGEELVSVIYGW